MYSTESKHLMNQGAISPTTTPETQISQSQTQLLEMPLSFYEDLIMLSDSVGINHDLDPDLDLDIPEEWGLESEDQHEDDDAMADIGDDVIVDGDHDHVDVDVDNAAAAVVDDEYFKRFPPGWRFVPTDKELMSEYLIPLLNNETRHQSPIKEVDIYSYHPSEFEGKYEKCNETEWYFYTKRDKRYPRGKRPARGAKGGYWKLTGRDTLIYNENRVLLGARKSLSFYNGTPKENNENNKTPWLMHEYTYDKVLYAQIEQDRKKTHTGRMWLDVVLCKIYNKNDKKKARRDEEGGGDGRKKNKRRGSSTVL